MADNLNPITDAEIEAGAEALAVRYFASSPQQSLADFSDSQQQDFRDKAKAVLEAARRVREMVNG